MRLCDKRIAVTGAAGYIGQNLVSVLAANGADVVQLDVEYGVDVSDKGQWVHRMDGVTNIVHLAAISGIAACEQDPQRAALSNVASTVWLLEHATSEGIPMIFASSQAAAAPTGTYAMSKSICESLITADNSEIADERLKHTVLRFANVFGGAGYLSKKSSVVSKFIKGALNDGVIVVDGDGNQERDFVSIGTVVDTIVAIINRDGAGFTEIVDVGTGVPTKIIELANKVKGYCKKDVEIRHAEGRSVGVASNVADPRVILANGIKAGPQSLDEYLGYIFTNVKQ